MLHFDVRIRSTTQLASISGQRVSVAPQQRAVVVHHAVRGVECNATATNVKLPATHVVASEAALQQLKASTAVNREYAAYMHIHGIILHDSWCCNHLYDLRLISINRCLTIAGYAMEKKSSIIAIGLTIHNAPVELREKLAVPEAEWPRAIQELCSYPHIEEAAVLSTCNRMEIYLVGLSFHRGEQRAVNCARNLKLGATYEFKHHGVL